MDFFDNSSEAPQELIKPQQPTKTETNLSKPSNDPIFKPSASTSSVFTIATPLEEKKPKTAENKAKK